VPAGQFKISFEGLEDSLRRFRQQQIHNSHGWIPKKKVEKFQYRHMNPLNRGLVTHLKHRPWSSFSFYSKSEPRLLRIDPVNWQGWGEGKKKPPSPNRERWGHVLHRSLHRAPAGVLWIGCTLE